MKKIFLINSLTLLSLVCLTQEALRIQSGGAVTIQSGADLVLQGGITFDNGSSLSNNGTIFRKKQYHCQHQQLDR